MSTLYLSHPDCFAHEMQQGHPERPDRLRAIAEALDADEFTGLAREEAPLGTREHVLLAHPAEYFDLIEQHKPEQGLLRLDGDTAMSPGSWNASLRGVGAIVRAVEEVVADRHDNAFCAVRPPGHHAEKQRAMGFCWFNNVAIGALHARASLGLERVAVVDFDVHHGNGTQDIFWSDEDMFFGSTHQMPLYPGTGAPSETGVGNIFNAPLRPNDGGERFAEAMRDIILPALKNFHPDLIMVSAGFDAHERDPLANLRLVEEDFAWATGELMEVAEKLCGGRLVSTLEGGYDLTGLSQSVAAHVRTLMGA